MTSSLVSEALTARVSRYSTDNLCTLLDRADEAWAVAMELRNEAIAVIDKINEGRPKGDKINPLVSHDQCAYRPATFYRTIRQYTGRDCPVQMPPELRRTITEELWLRSMETHDTVRALDVEDTEPVEVLSYIDGGGYEARVWSYLEQVELPAWYGMLRGVTQPDHPRVYRDQQEADREPPQHPDLTFPPALRRPDRVRLDGRDLDRAAVLARRRKRAALIRLLRE